MRIDGSSVMRWSALACLLTLTGGVARGAEFEPAKLPGIIVDDTAAELTGMWKPSTHVRPYVGDGYLHDDNLEKGGLSARFVPDLPKAGSYQISVSYAPGRGRSNGVPVVIQTADGPQKVYVNQKIAPPAGSPFVSLGVFKLEAGKKSVVTISNADTVGHVIVDALQFLPTEQTPTPASELATTAPPQPAVDTSGESAAKPAALPEKPALLARKLTPEELDKLVLAELKGEPLAPAASEEQFLRRATYDLVGRQPTVAELEAFAEDKSAGKRAAVIERLLASAEFGRNWGNYWSDVIGYRVPPPELTFLNYYPFKEWLATQINAGVTWDSIARDVLTASGTVGENPAATFVGFHEASPTRLASETSRVFLGVQIQCAECHDHPFESWKREQFHQLTAFFVRSGAKAPHNDSDKIVVKDLGKGEWQMPDAKDPRKKGPPMTPVLLTGEQYEMGKSDADRRSHLADWVGSKSNPWFAKAYANRIWGRLMGRGFYEPVDNMGGLAVGEMLPVHDALAGSFLATNYDMKELFRLVMNTQAYQRGLMTRSTEEATSLAAAIPTKLRSDEIFDSLVTAIELPNVTPPQRPKTAAERFPPPPKSTRDLINEAFGFDPSLNAEEIRRTLSQAMLLMNNDQLQAQVNASPDSGTVLAKLLASEQDDKVVVDRLFRLLFARAPSEKEVKIALDHVAEIKDRGPAFEDVLWSLLNSAEFTTKR